MVSQRLVLNFFWIFAISGPKLTRICNVLFKISELAILNPPTLYPSGPGEHPYYPASWSQEGEECSKLKKVVEGSYSDTNNNPPFV